MHVLNWHYVERDDFAADLRDQSGELTDEEIDRLHAAHREDVAAVQAEQVELLRRLLRRTGVRTVFIEGLHAENLDAFEERIEALREFARHKPDGDTAIGRLLLEEFEDDLLRLGAATRLLVAGELEAAVPCEDVDAYQAANPVRAGRVRFDAEAAERREAAIARNVLHAKASVAIVVLGGAHDLSNSLPDWIRYERLATKSYRRLAAQSETTR